MATEAEIKAKERKEILLEIEKVFLHGKIILGPEVQELENETSNESKLQYLIAISKIEALNSSHYEKI